MQEITPGLLQYISTGFRARFNAGLLKDKEDYNDIVMTNPSTTAKEIYPFTGDMPQLRKWVGDRVIRDFKGRAFEIENEDFEGTVSVKKNDIEDDKFGFYGNEAEMLGQNAAAHPMILIAKLIELGRTLLGYDGAPFFSATHPNPKTGNQSNLTIGAGQALTPDATGIAAIKAVRLKMRKLKDDVGEPLGIVPDTLIVPVDLEDTARILTTQAIVWDGAVGVNNPVAGYGLKVKVMKRLTSATAWYLQDNTKVFRSIVWQLRQAIALTALTSMTDINVFMKKIFLWGCDYRGAAGFGLWQTMAASDVS